MKKKLLIIIGIICLIFIFLSLAVGGFAIYCASLVLDKAPLPRHELAYKPDAVNRIIEKTQKLKSSLMGTKSEKTEETLEFNGDEVNALLYMIMNRDKFQAFLDVSKGDQLGDKPKDYDIYFNNGKFIISFSKNIRAPSFLGTYLNVQIEAVPEIGQGKENIRLDSLKVGEVKVPVAMLKTKTDEIINAFKTRNDYELIKKIITEMKVDGNGNLLITYKTEELRKLVQDYFMKSMKNYMNK